MNEDATELWERYDRYAALRQRFQRLVGVNDKDDAIVLIDPLRRLEQAQVVEAALGILGERNLPAEAREEQADDQEQGGRGKPE